MVDMEKAALVNYVPVIGLEVHAQLSTRSKIYAADSALFGSEPNTSISAITLAHPGTLPRINRKVIEYAIRMGLACGSEISRNNIFCRKNYFYPDLPKGFQLTQDKTPICIAGAVPIKDSRGSQTAIRLNRIHVEEDAGKSLHQGGEADTLIDLNRAGVPLIEIVTEPVLRSPEEASLFLTEVRRLLRYLDICDGNMEEGSLRCDANVSVRPQNSDRLGAKVEIKNMNSIRNVRRAIEHEIGRQIALLRRGERIVRETRTWIAESGTSASMREKEELNDYRYFPEPDLSPVIVSEDWLNAIRSAMPVLPWQWEELFIRDYGLPEYDAQVLCESRELAEYSDRLFQCCANRKAAANWMMGPVKAWLNEQQLPASALPVTPSDISELIGLIDQGLISHTAAAQKLFPEMLRGNRRSPSELAEALNLIQKSDASFLGQVIAEALEQYPSKVTEYRNGKKGLIGFFMGEVMRKTSGKADPQKTQQMLTEALAKS
jgi:aspartyl-tRNA(Asn)/glutamyl-tRNA(Gln) amidotransferase subunit B